MARFEEDKPGFYRHEIVKPRGATVPYLDVREDNEKTALFDGCVGDTGCPEQIDAPDFEPRQVRCMVDDAHSVSFGVARTER